MTTPTIPDKMIAAQVVELKRLYELVEVPAPKDLAPDDLLIKTAVASLCHTDFMVLEGLFGDTLPRTGSHEGTGTVVAIGSDVQNVMIGDRVMASIFCHPCCGCNDCLGPENFSQYCQYIGGKKGVTTHGFFAGYAAIDATQAAKLPDRVSFPTAAPLACAGCTVWRGVLQSELKAAEWLAIVGSGGGLCHIGVQFGKALGLNLIGIDARDEVIEVTKQRKADIVIDAIIGREKVVEEVKKPDEVKIPFRDFVFRDIRLKGSLICSPEGGRRMLDVVAEHGISVRTNIFNSLKSIEDLVHLVKSGEIKGKGIIVVDPEQIKKENEPGFDMV